MANELIIDWIETGITVYAIVSNVSGQPWSTDASQYEDFVVANLADYVIALTEEDAVNESQRYIGDIPSGALATARSISYRKQAGGSPAITDQRIGVEDYSTVGIDGIHNEIAGTGGVHDDIDALATAVSTVDGKVDANGTAIASIQNNTRVVRVVPTVIERPDSGTQEYRIELLLYDEVGNMEAPDSAPTIALVDQGGTDLSSRLDSATMSLVSTGRYRAVYTASDDDDLEQLIWAFSVVEGGNTRVYGNTTIIVDTTAVDFTSADRTLLQAAATEATALLVKAKTDNLPASPAAVGDIPTAAQVRAEIDSNSTVLAFIKNVEEGDHYIDKSGSPWQFVITVKGTGGPGVGTELIRKDINDVDGTALAATTTVVGQLVEPA